MKATIKELWLEYLQDKNEKFSEEKRDISRRLCDAAEELISVLDKKQNKKFEEYCDARSDLYSIEEYEAFEKGVLFGARFILETTY